MLIFYPLTVKPMSELMLVLQSYTADFTVSRIKSKQIQMFSAEIPQHSAFRFYEKRSF